jgi:hypothetical protein
LPKTTKSKFEKKLKDGLETWTDEEALSYFVTFLDRVDVSNHFVRDEESGLIVGHTLVLSAGEKYLASDPIMLDWPLQPAPIPEEAKSELN